MPDPAGSSPSATGRCRSCQTHPVLVVRGTKKLRDRLTGVTPAVDDESTTVLGDWFATALFWRPHVALLVNQKTFLPVFMPLAPAATLLQRAPDAIADILRRHGADEAFVANELDEMRDVRVAATDDRSVVGVMSGFGSGGKFRMLTRGLALEELSVELAGMPLTTLDHRAGAPNRELAVILGIDTGKVVQFPVDRAAAPPTNPATTNVYQLKVTLSGAKPPIWRRLLVDGGATLHEVHEVIQAAFGWWNHHLYEFEFGRARYALPDPDWDMDFDMGSPTRDARTTRLDTVARSGTSFTYTYDFGDFWEHKVTVEKVVPASPELTVPSCTGGRRHGPPEDCGGVWGYEELLAILADPTHEEHEERRAWVAGMVDGDFDPERFDPGDFVDHLQAIRLAAFDN